MRFHLSTVILALLSLAACAPSADVTNTDVSRTVDIRAGEPAAAAQAPRAAPSSFLVQSFEVWMPFPLYKGSMKSRAIFEVSMFPSVADWSATCWTTTSETLCDPNVWYNCTVSAENERVMFRFGQDLTSVDIKRRWTYGETTMTVTASEPAVWNEGMNPQRQNVTVSQWGKCYKRPNGWKLDWKTMVG
ncbi:uncharacterized protein M421DRAFT_414887 [Didymella exigua CBS 183.55]|uniref:AA1-like domain-containing protein n=1 Tax=Didymella exigua CBS 183.55 TaxID=1150837 RepID=A0A6A5S1R5_9PLEO|nr:uncharacterized protein M421DRAFT_414887 [Didymella exigua CBS 183.55]KAF1933833.1 hypothetical protein M421DRAFT_414887 [Didymella exigua CBS 183.55]